MKVSKRKIGRLLKDKGILVYIIVFIAGISIILYPSVSNIWNSHVFENAASSYDAEVNTRKEIIDECFSEANQYNKMLSPKTVPDAFALRNGVKDPEYESMLNISENGMMGYVDIPVLDVKAPIYHYTSDETLRKGVGHLPGSSLPIGGSGTHSVLSAHRGLPKAKLFTDLNLLDEQDAFFIHILDRVLKYEVDQILVVEPDETDALAFEEGEDLMTLVTCTPYGINSHRLLVRGHRVPYVAADEEKTTRKTDIARSAIVLLCVLLGALLAFVMGKTVEAVKKRKTYEKQEHRIYI